MLSTVKAWPMMESDSSFSLVLSACFASIGLHLRKVFLQRYCQQMVAKVLTH
jgi:hypothetical protein